MMDIQELGTVKMTLKEVGVQLLVPKAGTTDCSSLLPEGSQP